MTRLTPQELDERIAVLYGISQSQLTDKGDFKHFTERLIRDCIEAVTPERSKFEPSTEKYHAHWVGYEGVIDTIEANTKELLG